MSGTGKKPDFKKFRATLTKLERLIGVWRFSLRDQISYSEDGKVITSTTGDGIIHTLLLLLELNINTSESNTIQELERLLTIKTEIRAIPCNIWKCPTYDRYCASNQPNISTGILLERLTEFKVAFLNGGTFSRLISEGGVEPMTALERLTKIQLELQSVELGNLLTSRMNEVVYTCEDKASARFIPIICENLTHTLQPLTKPVTDSSSDVVDPVHASQKQEIPNRNLPGEGKMPKTTKTVLGSSSGLGDQNNIHMQWLLDQNKVHEEWIHDQIEAHMNRDVDSRLKDEDKVHKQLTQDQNKVNMQWLQHQMGANMVWIRDQNEAQMKWHQKQNEAQNVKDDVDSSEEDREELTPTSTVTSGW